MKATKGRNVVVVGTQWGDEGKGKLYLNDNGTAKGWGKKKVGGLLAKFKGKPELSADHFEDLSAHEDVVTSGGGGSNGGDIKEQIASLREGLSCLLYTSPSPRDS